MAQRKTLLIVDDDQDLRGAIAEQLQTESFDTLEAATAGDGVRLARGTCVRRGLGLDERELVARPDSPKRCTLPMTALRVTPPKRPAI